MMYQRQGHNECALAVLAMLSGTPLEEIRIEANAQLRESGWDLGYGKAVHNIPLTDIVEELYARYGLLSPRDWFAAEAGAVSGTDKLPPGRGEVTFTITEPGAQWRHVAAFENGLVYDPGWPETERGVPLSAYLAGHPSYTVDGIHSEPDLPNKTWYGRIRVWLSRILGEGNNERE